MSSASPRVRSAAAGERSPQRRALVTDLQPEIITFLFTDVEGSTRLWEAQPRAMSVALARHDAILHAAIASAGGTVFKTVGDAFCAVFSTPEAAIEAAVVGQRALSSETTVFSISYKVRIDIHSFQQE